jgi:hypothetical protein
LAAVGLLAVSVVISAGNANGARSPTGALPRSSASRADGFAQISAALYVHGNLNQPRANELTVTRINIRARGPGSVPNGAAASLRCVSGCYGADTWRTTGGTFNRRSFLLDGAIVRSRVVVALAIRAAGYIGLYKRVTIVPARNPARIKDLCLWGSSLTPRSCAAVQNRMLAGSVPGRYCGSFGDGGKLCIGVSNDFVQRATLNIDAGNMPCTDGSVEGLTLDTAATSFAGRHFVLTSSFNSVGKQTGVRSTWHVAGVLGLDGTASASIGIGYDPRPGVHCSVSADWSGALRGGKKSPPPMPVAILPGRYCGATSELTVRGDRPLVNICFAVTAGRIVRSLSLDAGSSCSDSSVVVSVDSSTGPRVDGAGRFHFHDSSFDVTGTLDASGGASGTLTMSFDPGCDPGEVAWTATRTS